jgi:16S rRNA (uracil1498-N3)-methyltransferase
MKVHRFFVTGNIPALGEAWHIEDAGIARQMSQVLRLLSGEQVEMCTGTHTAVCTLLACTKHACTLHVQTVRPSRIPEKKVTLYQAIVKGDTFEIIAQKATELGVSSVVPVISDRTIKTGVRPDRLIRIATEAAEQSGRDTVPHIFEPLSLGDALRGARAQALTIMVCDTVGTKKYTEHSHNAMGIFIGPEGGWTDAERELFAQYDAQSVSLGSTVLRADTAATVAVFACMYGTE